MERRSTTRTNNRDDGCFYCGKKGHKTAPTKSYVHTGRDTVQRTPGAVSQFSKEDNREGNHTAHTAVKNLLTQSGNQTDTSLFFSLKLKQPLRRFLPMK